MSLLQMSFYGAILIIAIVFIRAVALHRLPKKVFVILWGIALLRLLVPFSIPSKLSLYSLLPVRLSVQNLIPQSGFDTVLTPEPTPLPSPDIHDTAIPVAGLTDGAHWFLPLWTIFWLLGFLFVFVFFVISYFRFHREFATSLPIKEEAILSWKNCHPLKWEYEIRQSDKISAPLTYGIFHPVILLPKSINLEEEKQLHYVLLHEYTHIRHLDTLTKLLIILTVCLHWFNPAVWVMYFLFNRDIEFFCDECVLSEEEEDTRSSYANTLIHLEEQHSFSMPLCNHFSRTALEERIVSIMKSKKTTFGMILAGGFIVIALCITLLTTADTAYGNSFLPSLPTPTVTPTPTPEPMYTVLPTITPTPQVTVAPDGAVTQKTRLTSGELYETVRTIFEQFRQTMNNEVYRWDYYPERYSLTVWKHREDHISIDYCFYSSDYIKFESGVISLIKKDGVWQIVAFLPDV